MCIRDRYEMANYEAERIGRLVDKQILSKIRLDQANKEQEVAQMKVEPVSYTHLAKVLLTYSMKKLIRLKM